MPPSLDKRFGWLRDPIGGLGFLFWLGSFKLSTWLRDNDWQNLADMASGYVLGFGTAFTGWILVHLWKGHWSKFIDPHPVWKWFSVFVLIVIFFFGLAGAFIDLFGNTNGYFNVSFWFGTFVMGVCFGPLVDEIDGL